MIRSVVFLVFGVLALGVAGMNASRVEPDAQVPYFIGGALWAVICFVIALWPSKKAARPERAEAEPGTPRKKRTPRPWDRRNPDA